MTDYGGEGPRPIRLPDLIAVTATVAALLGIYIYSGHRYLLFHTLAEVFSVVVGFATFVTAWYTRAFTGNSYLLIIGIAALAVGGVDLLHALAYQGMGIFAFSNSGTSTELWVLARYIEAGALVAALARPTRVVDPVRTFVLFGTLAGLGVTSILEWQVFPASYVDGHGLTTFKIVSEYIIIALLLVALWLLRYHRGEFHVSVYVNLSLALMVRVLAEICFTLYTDLYGILPVLGHLLKILASIFVLRAFVETGLKRPQALIARSIERERNLTEAVMSQANTLSAVLKASPDIMLLVDGGMRCSHINAWRAEDANLQAAEPSLPAPVLEPLRVGVRRVFAGESATTFEAEADDRRWEYRLAPLPDGEGGVGAVLAVVRDVTARAQAEQRLRDAYRHAARANDAKSRFIAAASHDLRQPFQAIRLFLEVLKVRLKDQENREVVQKACAALESGESLLHALLDLSTLEAGTVRADRREFILAELLERIELEWAPQAAEKGLEFRTVRCGAVVQSDPVLLQRILRNLVANALRYTRVGRILVGCRRHGDTIRLMVCDTGPGIPPDKLDAIFDEFVQLGNEARNRAEGLGLGLSIVRKTAALLDHPLHVESRVGRGSVFAIEVPLAERRQLREAVTAA